ncbi:glycosyltransferase [Acidimicrobiia bacterium]|nr:glycosyltransferase [Acidimicrobiia bacterium]
MKILIIHTKYKHEGGEDIAVDNEFNFFKNNIETDIIYFQNEKITTSNYISFLQNKNKNSIKQIMTKVEEFKPDVVYIHNTWFEASLGIIDYLLTQDVEILIKLHNFRYDCINAIHYRNEQACHDCSNNRLSGIKNKCYDNSYLKSSLVTNYSKKYRSFFNKKIKLIVLSEFHKKYLSSLGYENNVFILPNPISLEDYANTTYNSESDYGIYAGRVSEEKGIKELVETWNISNMGSMKLLIIGDGPSLGYFQKQNYKNISFLGKKTNQETLETISNARFTISATRVYEGQPTLLTESSKLKIPTIFPVYGGISSFLPNTSKLQFEQFNYEDLRRKIESTLDKELMLKESKENFNFYKKMFNEKDLLQKFKRIVDF